MTVSIAEANRSRRSNPRGRRQNLRFAATILGPLVAILSGCGGGSDALIQAYEGCYKVSVVFDGTGEYENEDGYSGLDDNGETLWAMGSGGFCLLKELNAPGSITRTMTMGSAQQTSEWDDYTMTWSWEGPESGLSVVISA